MNNSGKFELRNAKGCLVKCEYYTTGPSVVAYEHEGSKGKVGIYIVMFSKCEDVKDGVNSVSCILSPDEAREYAKDICKKADKAEAMIKGETS